MMRRSLQLLFGAAVVATTAAATGPTRPSQADAAVYEIRSYHFEPSQIDAYRTWAREWAVPHLREQMDVVGFWVEGDIPTEVTGDDSDPLGTANVTWVIRWPSKEVRDRRIQEVFGSTEWREIFSHLGPGPAGYRRIEVKFFDAI